MRARELRAAGFGVIVRDDHIEVLDERYAKGQQHRCEEYLALS